MLFRKIVLDMARAENMKLLKLIRESSTSKLVRLKKKVNILYELLNSHEQQIYYTFKCLRRWKR